ncbi:mucin-2-like [Xiphophorus hellerii]|uniref:mucin-2-like n=1 Tax=Xiphophorus hellerii TaxID=8084 RepID=UPI0013B436EE|nr:mucin-2-like [Xiphophorus hellerii]
MKWTVVWLCFFSFAVEIQATLADNHVNNICSTWGTQHFKTFDGDVFQFPGLCEYNLVKDCRESEKKFSVHIRRDENDGNITIRYVVVTISENTFNLTETEVTENGNPVTLPHYSGGVKVEESTFYIRLRVTKVGITVMWNREDAVMVEVSNRYKNQTCGLCGDFNGVPVYNEFMDNGFKMTPIELGIKHRVHLPNDECKDPHVEDAEPKTNVSHSCKAFQTICEQIFNGDSWSSCTSLISAEAFIKACVVDMCACNNGTSDFCVCSTMSEFSRQCSHAGEQPPDWRRPDFCGKQCPYNMQYEESAFPCMDTCTHQDTRLVCEEHKIDGCFCPPGTVFDDISERGCIPLSECQCKHDDIYDSGEVYRHEKTNCTCSEGKWECETFETPATCAVEEGLHFTTFDGTTYTFHGNCLYTLAKVESKDGISPNFTIRAQLGQCGEKKSDICLKALKIHLGVDNVLMFTSEGKVQQNMEDISLPYYSGDIRIFHASSFHILLNAKFGLQIQIQRVPVMQAYISLESSYKEKTRGLCGNYNMALNDDMTTPQGSQEGTAVTFGNSWKADQTCPDAGKELDRPCTDSMETENYARHWCEMLRNSTGSFANCHSEVNPDYYYKRCLYSTCSCEKSEDCLCAVFTSYGRACAAKGKFVTDFGNQCEKHTKSCPSTQIFTYNHRRCQLTCSSLSSDQQSCTSHFLPVVGCFCPDGLYLNEKDTCVPKEECSCSYNEDYIEAGTSVNIKSEHWMHQNVYLAACVLLTSLMMAKAPRATIILSDGAYKEEGLENGTKKEYRITNLGFYIVLASKIGLTVIWDRKTYFVIQLESQFMGQVCGLCGNFDGNGENDFTTRSGLVVSSPLEFANSWKGDSSCSDVDKLIDACEKAPHRDHWAKMKCNIINGDTFKECHSKVEPLLFYENCVKDTCACDTGGDCECFCSAVAAYAQACNEANVSISWRTPEICPVFCDYYNDHDCLWHYHPGTPKSYQTCSNYFLHVPKLEESTTPKESTTTTETPTTTTTITSTTTSTETTTIPTGTTESTTPSTKYTTVTYPTTTTIPTTESTTPTQSTTTAETPTSTPIITTPTTSTESTTIPTGTTESTTPSTKYTTVTYPTTTTTPTTESTTPKESTTTTETPTTTTTITTPTTSAESTTIPTGTTESTTPSTQNETFYFCNCTMAKCIGSNTLQIVPYECPPIKNITCSNGKSPVLVYDEFQCCQHYQCDCECKGWGDHHYSTFDGLSYKYHGNCSYYLMKEIAPRDDLEMYIDDIHCDPFEDPSCPQSLNVNYGAEHIKLVYFILNGQPDLKAFTNEVSLKLPYWKQGVKVMSTGTNLVLEILRLNVVVKFGRTGFSINLPYKYFGGNTQGHCGTCTNSQADDCWLPGGTVSEGCTKIADGWLLEKDRGCKTGGEPPLKTPCSSSSVCKLLKSSVFAQCHSRISPDNYYKGCVSDSCHVHNGANAVECSSLATYAAACSDVGVCIHWRNHTGPCASDCPSDKIYKPCGPADQPSCEDSPNDPGMNFTTEGCFCPEGMKLFSRESKICVKNCGCLDPKGTPREFDETFEYQCQNCVCDESTKTVICKPKKCKHTAFPRCMGPGYVLVNQTDPSNPCCNVHVCQCQVHTCRDINMNCDVGFKPKISVPEGKCCPELRCEPKRVCVQNDVEYRGFKYVKSKSDECCGTCEQTHCVFSVNGTEILLQEGETWSPPENKCESKTCVKNGETFTVTNQQIICPAFQESNCKNDTIQTAANGCCKICVEKEKACRLVSRKTPINHNGCQSELNMPSCEGSCDTFTKYSEAAGAMEHSCSCCKERSASNRTVTLACNDGAHVQFTYVHVEECGCGHTECTTPAALHVRRKRRFTLQ